MVRDFFVNEIIKIAYFIKITRDGYSLGYLFFLSVENQKMKINFTIFISVNALQLKTLQKDTGSSNKNLKATFTFKRYKLPP